MLRPLKSKMNLDELETDEDYSSRISRKFFKKENSVDYLIEKEYKKGLSSLDKESRVNLYDVGNIVHEGSEALSTEKEQREVMKLNKDTQKILTKIKSYERNTLRSMVKSEKNRAKIERLRKAVIPKLSTYTSIKDLNLEKN